MPGARSFVPGAPWLLIAGGALRGFCIDWAIAGVKASSIKADDTNRRRMVGSFRCSVACASDVAWDRGRPARSSPTRLEGKVGESGLSQRKHVSDEIILFLLVQLEAED